MMSFLRPMTQTGQTKHQLSLIHAFHIEIISYVSQPPKKTDHICFVIAMIFNLMQEKQLKQ